MSLSAALFLKTARLLPQSDNYLLLPEGRPCTFDEESVLPLLGSLPEQVVFSEMFSHQGEQPSIRVLSGIESAWVAPYLEEMKRMESDDFLVEVQSMKRKVDPEKEKEILNLERMALKQEKLQEAQERFQERKRFHHM